MKLLVIYHIADLDGKCSGAIIKRWFEQTPDYESITLYGMNYGDETPKELIKNADLVIMSDFSLPLHDMVWTMGNTKLLWFDHHISAINEMKNLRIFGSRDTAKAGCELTWEGLFPDKEMPPVVEMLSSYDCWRWVKEDKNKQERILNLQYGMRLESMWPDDERWRYLLAGPGDLEQEMQYLEWGKAVRRYQANQMERINSSGMIVTWEGFRWFAVNTHNASSTDFAPKIEELKEERIQGVISYHRRKDGSWKYSLRSFSEDLDVSLIAKKNGGGGHVKAARFGSKRIIGCLK